MLQTALSLSVALLALIGIGALWYFLRKQERKNTVVTTQESLLHWPDIKCVRCGQAMAHGFTFTGKGIHWAPRHGRKPGTLITIMSALENTFSLRLPPPVNMTWHCDACKLLVIDHSKMIRFKKTN